MAEIKFHNSKIKKLDKFSNQILNDLISREYPGFTTAYTDASVDPMSGACGIGISCPQLNLEASFKLSNQTNICTAEIFAIRMGIQMLKNRSDNILIVSDSESGLKKLGRTGLQGKNDFISLSTRLLIFETSRTKTIKLIWVPSHSGVEGNERADRKALLGRTTGQHINNKLHYLDILNTIKNSIWSNWTRIFQEVSTHKGYKYSLLQNSPLKTPWFKNEKFIKRKFITYLCRMRTGHCLTPVHLHKIGIKEDPLCSCGERGDLNHITLGCNNNNNMLQNYFNLAQGLSSPLQISDILLFPAGKTAKHLCQFLDRQNIKI